MHHPGPHAAWTSVHPIFAAGAVSSGAVAPTIPTTSFRSISASAMRSRLFLHHFLHHLAHHLAHGIGTLPAHVRGARALWRRRGRRCRVGLRKRRDYQERHGRSSGSKPAQQCHYLLLCWISLPSNAQPAALLLVPADLNLLIGTHARVSIPLSVRGNIWEKTDMKNLWTVAALAVLISGCQSATQPATTVDFGPQALTLINSYRTSRGLSPLASNATLTALARQHSRHQAARNAISHDGYRQRSAQAKAAGLSGICAENVGVKYRSAQQLFSGWRNSGAHNTNLLRPQLRHAGVSVVGGYATYFAC
jgi:uncharacterized protein YkwD